MANGVRRAGVAGLLLASAVIAGCAKPQAGMPPMAPPKVFVAVPFTKDVTDYEEFTGRTEAFLSVDLRARVTGDLRKVLFKDGTDVKEDQPLFEINPELYQAEFDRTSGVVRQTEARLKQLQADYQRARMSGAAVSKQDYDKAAADLMDSEANIKVAQANQKMARINRSYCTVKAPFAGRISRRMIDPGNLVKADDTILTTIVNVDKIYVYFDVDERTLLRIRRLTREGSIVVRDGRIKVEMALADERNYPHTVEIDFEDNRVDVATGTLRVRGILDNPNRLVSPGLFVRIRLPISHPASTILVAEQALGTDQGQKFVYVLDDKNMVEYRQVEVGRLHTVYDEDAGMHRPMRAITHGLTGKERVVVSGLQRVRQGVKVTPQLLKMEKVGRKPKAPAVVQGDNKIVPGKKKSEK